MSVLLRIIADFVARVIGEGGDALPVFDDFFRYVSSQVVPRIVPERDGRGNIVSLPKSLASILVGRKLAVILRT